MKENQKKSNRIVKSVVAVGMLVSACCMYGGIKILARQEGTPQTTDAYMVLQNVAYVLLVLLLGYISYMVLFYHKSPVLLQNLYLVMGLTLVFVYLLCIPIKAVPDE